MDSHHPPTKTCSGRNGKPPEDGIRGRSQGFWPFVPTATERRVIDLLGSSEKLHLSTMPDTVLIDITDGIKSLHWDRGLPILGIASRLGKSQSFLWRLCRILSVPTRGIPEANRLSAPSRRLHQMSPFAGSDLDRAYLRGFSRGDLNVARPTEVSLFVSTTTTHPAFSALFQQLFSRYGHIYTYPIRDDLGRFKWKVAVRLDRSFDFLLPTTLQKTFAHLSSPSLRAAWLAGFVDTDGHVGIVRSGVYARFRVAVSSSKRPLLNAVASLMRQDGYHFDGPYRTVGRGYTTKSLGITYNSDHWMIALQRNEEVKTLLSALPLKHQEKAAMKSLAIGSGTAVRWSSVAGQVTNLREEISQQVADYAREAEARYNSRESRIKGA